MNASTTIQLHFTQEVKERASPQEASAVVSLVDLTIPRRDFFVEVRPRFKIRDSELFCVRDGSLELSTCGVDFVTLEGLDVSTSTSARSVGGIGNENWCKCFRSLFFPQQILT